MLCQRFNIFGSPVLYRDKIKRLIEASVVKLILNKIVIKSINFNKFISSELFSTEFPELGEKKLSKGS